MNETEITVRCIDVLNRYALAVADRDIDTFVNLFAPDGVWTRPGDMVMRGHDEIRAFMDSVKGPHRLIRHMNAGAVVDVIDAQTAHVRSMTNVYESDSCIEGRWTMRPPSYVAEYRDVMRKIDGRWLIQRRDTTVVLVSENPLPLPGIKDDD